LLLQSVMFHWLSVGFFRSFILPPLPRQENQAADEHIFFRVNIFYQVYTSTKCNVASLLEIIIRFKIILQHHAVYKLGLFSTKFS